MSTPINSIRSIRAQDSGRRTIASLFVLACLLVLPIVALYRLRVDLRWAGAYALAVSTLTWWTYTTDKRRAQLGEWRISEAQLHLWELSGGWPAAWVAQRRLRHKTSKASYQLVFWFIILAWQFAAFDSFHDWHFSRAALKAIEQNKRVQDAFQARHPAPSPSSVSSPRRQSRRGLGNLIPSSSRRHLAELSVRPSRRAIPHPAPLPVTE